MKKLFAIALMLTLVVGAIGCSKDTKSTGAAAPAGGGTGVK